MSNPFSQHAMLTLQSFLSGLIVVAFGAIASPQLEAQSSTDGSAAGPWTQAMNRSLGRVLAWELAHHERFGRYSLLDSTQLDSLAERGVQLRMLVASDSGWVALARHDSTRIACLEIGGAAVPLAAFVFDPNRCATYVPGDLAEAVTELHRWVPRSDVQRYQRLSEETFLAQEGLYGLGHAIRNTWHLNSVNRLTRYFDLAGVTHPEDRSCAILMRYHRQITGKGGDAAEVLREIRSRTKRTEGHR